MAQVNIFVSSTCYDLSQIRHDIKQCILDFGHNPILSEMKNFPIDPNLTSSENCINTVKSEADIFILIIGDHYGSVLESGKSITNTEFLTAVNKGAKRIDPGRKHRPGETVLAGTIRQQGHDL